MDALSLRNIRSFSAPPEVALRPITVLVGENSTGKSTMLAATRLCWDAAAGARALDFNEDPFSLGAFDQIAHFRGGKAGRSKTFSIGFTKRFRVKQHPSEIAVDVRYEFSRKGSHPFLSSYSLDAGICSLRVVSSPEQPLIKLEIVVADKVANVDFTGASLPSVFHDGGPIDVHYLMFRSGLSPRQPRGQIQATLPLQVFSDEEFNLLNSIIDGLDRSLGARPVAMAPIRNKPLRTYHPTSELPVADGAHVPLALAKVFFQSKDEWERLKKEIDDFGSKAGLFSSLDVKALGRHEGDPFQLTVKIEGPSSNIVDVGYGVSQVLPILVDPLLAKRGTTFLMQQPEVHLHPRGQAQLANFLGRLVKSRGIRFVVETHSDYFLSRLQIAIRKQEIDSSSVGVVYFERKGIETALQNLQFGDNGDYLEVPPGYRDFFLREEVDYLGVG